MRKVVRTIAGFVLLAVGVVLSLPGVPGPGFAVILLGLVILADHFEWARRLLDWAKQKARTAQEKITRRRADPQA